MIIGLIELFKSKKATLSLIILACATTALFMGKLDGQWYAAVISSIVLIYNWTQHKIDLQQAATTIVNNLPLRGQP